jgi:hypothetical protein
VAVRKAEQEAELKQEKVGDEQNNFPHLVKAK